MEVLGWKIPLQLWDRDERSDQASEGKRFGIPTKIKESSGGRDLEDGFGCRTGPVPTKEKNERHFAQGKEKGGLLEGYEGRRRIIEH